MLERSDRGLPTGLQVGFTDPTEAETLRHYCRNPQCSAKLRAPVRNAHEAFCSRGCYACFYRIRCRVCEAPIEQPTRGARLRADVHLGAQVLAKPNKRQSAAIAQTTPLNVYWACRRMKYRDAILRGDLPLVPTATNGEPIKEPAVQCQKSPLRHLPFDELLIGLARMVGRDRWLHAASAAGI